MNRQPSLLLSAWLHPEQLHFRSVLKAGLPGKDSSRGLTSKAKKVKTNADLAQPPRFP